MLTVGAPSAIEQVNVGCAEGAKRPSSVPGGFSPRFDGGRLRLPLSGRAARRCTRHVNACSHRYSRSSSSAEIRVTGQRLESTTAAVATLSLRFAGLYPARHQIARTLVVPVC